MRLLIGALLGWACGASAHELGRTAPVLPSMATWTFEPWVVASLAFSAIAYAAGLARLWRRAGVGRGVSVARAGGFAAGWLLLVVALVSPLDALGGLSFSAHMLQHELLMVLVAPLMVAGRPLAVWAWALPMPSRRRAGGWLHAPPWRAPWRLLSSPLGAWLVHAALLWLWHLPSWFEAALRDNTLHSLQHASFLASALLFWWSVLGAATRSAHGVALLSLFTTMLHTGALGALLAMSPQVWYPSYLETAAALGWNPLDDQQLGGVLMWVPGSFAYVLVGLATASRCIGLVAEVTPSSPAIRRASPGGG